MDKERDEALICRVAVSFTPGVNADVVRHMEEKGVSPEDFVFMTTPELNRVLGLNSRRHFQQEEREAALFRARKEVEYARCHNIRILYLSDVDYPERLSHIPDAPVVLYMVGECDLDAPHTVSIVGTRRCTPYGRNFTEDLVKDMAAYYPDLTIVSGLAYGIDAAAHTAALEADVKTIAVVAHGLNSIYPAQHTELARCIVKCGGCIISEYPSGTPAHRGNFLARNRIVAGLSPLTIVAESEVKGGAMSTARHANDYDRQVMALPGRNCDKTSSGCNFLIRRNLASLVERAADVVELMGWQPPGMHINTEQRNLFPELEGDVKTIYDCLRLETSAQNIDAIRYKTGLAVRRIMELLPDMEFDGIIARGPGNSYMVIR